MSVTTGFCAFVHKVEPLAAFGEFYAHQAALSLWRHPTLQVIDVQSVPVEAPPSAPESDRLPTAGGSASLYVLLSDSEQVVWCIAPKASPLESALQSDVVEVGTLVVLLDYAVVVGRGGKNVVIALRASWTHDALSLIGDPNVPPPPMVYLSSSSLISKKTFAAGSKGGAGGCPGDTAGAAAGAFAVLRTLSDVLGHSYADCAPNERWVVLCRLLWKSACRTIVNRRSETNGEQPLLGGVRCVFDAIVVDHDGSAAKAVFWGSSGGLFDAVGCGDVLSLSGGNVKRDAHSGSHEGQFLQFHERSAIECFSMETIEAAAAVTSSQGPIVVPKDVVAAHGAIPWEPRNVLGTCAVPPLLVSQVLHQASVGDVVSVIGCVSNAPSTSDVRTMYREAMVARQLVVLRDPPGQGTPAGSFHHTMEVTLWEDAARNCNVAHGEVCCFRDVVVRMYGTAKQLSSRSATETIRISGDAAFAFAEALRSAALTGDRSRLQLAWVSALSAGAKQRYADARRIAAAQHCPPREPLQTPVTPSQAVPVLWSATECIRSSSRAYVAVKIQRIKLPIFYLACAACGAQMKGVACAACSAAGGATQFRFLLRMDLSDGVDLVANAIGFAAVAETLFGETTSEFVAHVGADPTYTQRSVDSVIGLPVLVRLTPTPEGLKHVVELKHIHLPSGCWEMLKSIQDYGNVVPPV